MARNELTMLEINRARSKNSFHASAKFLLPSPASGANINIESASSAQMKRIGKTDRNFYKSQQPEAGGEMLIAIDNDDGSEYAEGSSSDSMVTD